MTAADILTLLHGLWVLFILIGFPLALLLGSRWLRLLHSLGLGLYLLLAWARLPCPLTVAEEGARQSLQPGFSYQGSFISAWVERLLYGQPVPLWVFHVLAAVYLLLVISSWWWWKPGPAGLRGRH